MSPSKVISFKDLAPLSKTVKAEHKTVVFTVGAFDLLHSGHAKYLAEAKSHGDVLVVGVASDRSRRQEKGDPFPLLGEKVRAEVVAFLRPVDYVIVVEEDDLMSTLADLSPNVFCTLRKDWESKLRSKKEEALVKRSGGKVMKVAQDHPYLSSSQLITQVADLKIRQVVEYAFPGTRLNLEQGKPYFFNGMIDLADQTPGRLLALGFRGKLLEEKELEGVRETLKKKGKKIVFTAGSFDLLHVGHARYLSKAREQGDILVVGVSSNQAIRELKGPGRPMVDEASRANLLCFLEPVDYVVIVKDRSVRSVLRKLKPDIFWTVEEDWNKGFKESPEYHLVTGYGGIVLRAPRQAPFVSASQIIAKAAGARVKELFKDCLKELEKKEIDPYSEEFQKGARLGKYWYEEIYKNVKKCPFCDLKEKYVIAEEEGVVWTVNLFPYIDGHTMFIPKRHIVRIEELRNREWSAIKSLFEKAVAVYKEVLSVSNINFWYREGPESGKTLEHLHFQLLPFTSDLLEWHYQEINLLPAKLAERFRKAIKAEE